MLSSFLPDAIILIILFEWLHVFHCREILQMNQPAIGNETEVITNCKI